MRPLDIKIAAIIPDVNRPFPDTRVYTMEVPGKLQCELGKLWPGLARLALSLIL